MNGLYVDTEFCAVFFLLKSLAQLSLLLTVNLPSPAVADACVELAVADLGCHAGLGPQLSTEGEGRDAEWQGCGGGGFPLSSREKIWEGTMLPPQKIF